MMASISKLEQGEELALPWDLTEWVKTERLLQCITEEVETLDWGNPRLIAIQRDYPEFRPKMLLTLLTYAYATGVYGSQEITDGCYENETLRSISGGDPPSAQAIMAFRRENRSFLRWSLSQVFKRALRVKFDLGDSLLPPGLKRYLEDVAITRIDMARHIDRGNAG